MTVDQKELIMMQAYKNTEGYGTDEHAVYLPMKQIKLTTGEYLLVEVPEHATNEHLKEGRYFRTPPGQWEIIGRASELSEEQWKGIVESKKSRGGAYNSEMGYYQSTGWTTWYKNYLHPEPSINIPNTATKSGISLIKSHSMNPETTLVFIYPLTLEIK